MEDEKLRSEWEILFPGTTEYKIDGKVIHVKELSWEEMTSITKEVGGLLKDVTKITQGGNITGSTNINQLIQMGVFGIISNFMDLAPQRLVKIVVTGTDIPPDIVSRIKAKVLPLCVLKILEVNKELGQAFFDLGGKLGIQRKSAKEKPEKEISVETRQVIAGLSGSSERSSGQDLTKPESGS